MLLKSAGNCCSDYGWAVIIANIILNNQNRADPSLFRTNNGSQICIINVSVFLSWCSPRFPFWLYNTRAVTALFCDWFGMNPLHKTVTVVSVIKSLVLHFHWLLFDTTSRNRIPTGTLISDPVVLSGRQCKPAMAHGCHGIYPLRGSLRAALIAWSLLKGLWLDGSIIVSCPGLWRFNPAYDWLRVRCVPLLP